MKPPSQGNFESLSLEAAERIDAVCTRFEEAWKKSEPLLEEYLAGVTASERGPCFRSCFGSSCITALSEGSVPRPGTICAASRTSKS